jgi:hypothetical protein
MSKVSRDDQPKVEFSKLSQDQISKLAKDYISDKQRLEKTMKIVSIAKITGIAAAALLAPLSAPTLASLAIVYAVTLGIDTEDIAEKINEIRLKMKK